MDLWPDLLIFIPEMLLPDFKHCTLFNTGILNNPLKLGLLEVLSVDLQKPSGRQRSLFPSYEWEKHKRSGGTDLPTAGSRLMLKLEKEMFSGYCLILWVLLPYTYQAHLVYSKEIKLKE